MGTCCRRSAAWSRGRGSASSSPSVVFALLHGTQNLPLFADRLVFGLLAGLLVWRTGGLEAGIAAHVINNVFAYLIRRADDLDCRTQGDQGNRLGRRCVRRRWLRPLCRAGVPACRG